MVSLSSNNWKDRHLAIDHEKELSTLFEGIKIDNVGFVLNLWSPDYIWVTFRAGKMTDNLARNLRSELRKLFGPLKWKRSNRQKNCDWETTYENYWKDSPRRIWFEIESAPIAKNCHVEEYETTEKRFRVVCDKRL